MTPDETQRRADAIGPWVNQFEYGGVLEPRESGAAPSLGPNAPSSSPPACTACTPERSARLAPGRDRREPTDRDRRVTAAAVRRLRCDGYAVAATTIGEPLLSGLRAEADHLVGRFTRDGHRSDDYWFFNAAASGEPVLYRIHNLERQGSAFMAGLHDAGPLHDLAGEFLGVRARATACAMIVKIAGVAAAVPWHRDRVSVPPHTACNLSVFLDESVPENGCLEFVPGSHLLPDDADIDVAWRSGPVRAVSARPGDILAHDVRVVHGSRPNSASASRRSIVVEFAPSEFVLTKKDG